MKLGYIDYLNCYPFYYHMFSKKPLKGIDVISGYPNMLNQMMNSGKLDMSPISAATCADISGDVLVLPDFCLSSVGYVSSVILISRVPIDQLHKKRIGITSASHTSIVLLKILIKDYYRIIPEFVPTDPMPKLDGIDAALAIGNEAMVFEPKKSYFVYDLGKLWLEKTGFPVVFAVFAVRKQSAKKFAPEIKNVVSSYNKSLSYLLDEKKDLFTSADQQYPGISDDIEAYYNLLQFEFTENLKNALAFYFEKSGELGLTKKVAALEYFDI